MKTHGSVFTTSIVAVALLGSLHSAPLAATPTWSSTATTAYVTPSATQTGAALDNETLSIVVSLRLRNRSQLESVAQSVSGGGTPITHDEFMSTYAPTEAQAQAVVSYLSAMGFSNVTVDDNRLLVSADGTVGTASAAFNTSFAHFTLNGKSGVANVTAAQVPSMLGDVVLSVLGLETVESATTLAMFASHGAPNPQVRAPPPSGPQSYDPTAFPLIYSANTLPTGSSAKVGIISNGSQTLTQQVLPDLQLFESQNGLPTLSPTVVTVGSPSSGDSNAVLEYDLDSQSIQAMAGGSLASLTFYAAHSLSDADLAQAYSKVVSDDSAKIINVSLSECETTAYNNGTLATDDQTFLSAVAQGQAFSVASGDNGSRTCGASGNGTYGTSVSVSYPASSAYVVAVGGTSLLTNTNGTWLSETAWSYSGGGHSAYEQPTQWTQGVTSVPGQVFRVIPDVAMDADPNSGANIAYNNNYPVGPVGGTSLASPLFVGAWARIETAQGNAFGYPNPLMYSLTVPMAPFHDVTQGSNDDYSAGANWDYTTGWGSLIASTLSTDLAALPTAPSSMSDLNGGIACPSDTITWSAVSGATSYELYERQSLPTAKSIFTVVWTGTATRSIQTLHTGYAYYYRVKACTSDGCSQLSTADILVTQGMCQ